MPRPSPSHDRVDSPDQPVGTLRLLIGLVVIALATKAAVWLLVWLGVRAWFQPTIIAGIVLVYALGWLSWASMPSPHRITTGRAYDYNRGVLLGVLLYAGVGAAASLTGTHPWLTLASLLVVALLGRLHAVLALQRFPVDHTSSQACGTSRSSPLDVADDASGLAAQLPTTKP